MNFFFRDNCFVTVCFDDWDDMELIVSMAVISGILFWGYFRNGRFKGIDGYKGIDRLTHWFKSLLLNQVICTFGIFCLDMILIENIQMENPRHVIDAMSSLQLVLNLWWNCGFLCFLFYDCRKSIHQLMVKLFDRGIAYRMMSIMMSYLLMMKDKRRKNKGWIQGLKEGRSCWIGFLMILQWNLLNVFCFNLFVFSLFGVGSLWHWFLRLHYWTVGFFKGLTPCFGLNGDWWCGYCKGVKLPFFPTFNKSLV